MVSRVLFADAKTALRASFDELRSLSLARQRAEAEVAELRRGFSQICPRADRAFDHLVFVSPFTKREAPPSSRVAVRPVNRPWPHPSYRSCDQHCRCLG